MKYFVLTFPGAIRVGYVALDTLYILSNASILLVAHVLVRFNTLPATYQHVLAPSAISTVEQTLFVTELGSKEPYRMQISLPFLPSFTIPGLK